MNTLRQGCSGVPCGAAWDTSCRVPVRDCSTSSRSWSITAPHTSLTHWRSPAKQPSGVQPAEWARRLSHVRVFARHRSATDPRTQIPPAGLLPYRPKRAQPYIYSDEEIRDLLRAALKLPDNGGLRPWTYHCLFGLLSVSGPTCRRSAEPRTAGR